MNLTQDEKVSTIRDLVDELCNRIMNRELDLNQSQLEAEKIREQAKILIPEQMDKFDLIYKSRLQRLTQQFLTNE